MGEILALGITHYPPLSGPDERMSFLHKRMLSNPHLPPEKADPANWPEAMREEWGSDEGLAGAIRHRAALLGHFAKVRAALDAFNPDFLLIWGDDQYENFKEDVIPPYCINAHDEFVFGAPRGNVWGEGEETRFTLPGVPQAGKALTAGLIEEGFDMAYSYRPLHHGLGHAFSNAIHYLDYDRRGFDYPILPVSVNCYGRHVIAQKGGLPSFDVELGDADLDPPAPTPRRLFDLGAATARILRDMPYRVAVVASSGWSHAFLNRKDYFLHPDIGADRYLYDALREGRYEAWRNYPSAAVEPAGQQEVLNWMCLAGALSELGSDTAPWMEFVETWIFNSPKVFLISAPGHATAN